MIIILHMSHIPMISDKEEGELGYSRDVLFPMIEVL